MVQLTKVREIREAWEAKGSPPCDHPSTDREYYLGSHTGDDACLVCGDSWPSGQKPEGFTNPGRIHAAQAYS